MGGKLPVRFHEPFNEIFGRPSKVALLRYLVLYWRETTGRDLARSVGLDHKTCLDALRDLVRNDIIRQRGIGRAWAFSLNHGFPIVKDVLEPLFEWERDILDRLARDLRKALGRDALAIFLYGSTAKGTDKAESDVDLLIVARDRASIRVLEEKSDASSARLMANYSRVPQHLFMDVRTFRAKFMKSDRFLTEILRTGRLLDGLHVQELFKHGRPARRGSKGPPR